jgi:hypothetical protein
MAVPVVVELSAVIVAVSGQTPRILTVEDALPRGPLDPELDPTLGLGLRRCVRERTGLELDYIEQLYTFGDRDRCPMAGLTEARALSVGYLTLVREGRPFVGGEVRWRDWYGLFPWEDWRLGRPALLEQVIAPALDRWVEAAADPVMQRLRRARVDVTFGLGGSSWDAVPALERYELLYEAGLVAEARRDRTALLGSDLGTDPALLGKPLVFDHRRIAATALGRLRGKLSYRPVVFELLPPAFTLLRLQQVVEALAGTWLHKQNFRRLVERGRLVEGTGRYEAYTGGRPAELFRFRQEVLWERSRAGVTLPGQRG